MPTAASIPARPRSERPAPASPLPLLLRRHSWWVEIAVVVGFYLAYASTRAFAPGTPRAARANAGRLLEVELWSGLHPELWLNHLLAPVDWLSALAGYYYLTLHFAVTVATLALLYVRRPHLYAHARTSLVLASAVALLAFWFLPVAPPRMAEPGIHDLVVQHNVFGAADAQRGQSPFENVYAAMPSLHVGWALWVALVARRSLPPRYGRWAWLYPVTTTLVVLSTGNHYLVDAVAGAALVLAGEAVSRRLVAVRAPVIHPDRTAERPSMQACSWAAPSRRGSWTGF